MQPVKKQSLGVPFFGFVFLGTQENEPGFGAAPHYDEIYLLLKSFGRGSFILPQKKITKESVCSNGDMGYRRVRVHRLHFCDVLPLEIYFHLFLIKQAKKECIQVSIPENTRGHLRKKQCRD
jgi:hypothetical protein